MEDITKAIDEVSLSEKMYAHSTQHTAHSTQHTAHSTQHTAHVRLLTTTRDTVPRSR
jgi:hypothetical protein